MRHLLSDIGQTDMSNSHAKPLPTKLLIKDEKTTAQGLDSG